MRTIPAQEIKRCGISIIDDILTQGPVHIIKNNQPQYVVLTEEHYQELTEAEDLVYLDRIRKSINDVQAGRTTSFKTANDLIMAIEDEG